jgi:ferredoxin-NADP reductase
VKAVDKISKIKDVLESPGDCRREAVALCDEYIDEYEEYDTSTPEGMSEAVKQALADLGVTGVQCNQELSLDDALHMTEKQTDDMLHLLMHHFPVDAKKIAALQDESRKYLMEKIDKTDAAHIPATLGLLAYVSLNVLKHALSRSHVATPETQVLN